MINLNDPKVYSRLDPMEMRERIRELPQQCLQAWQKGLDFELPPHYSNVNKLVILGMGGSAIGGDLLRSLNTEGKALILVDREYDIPSIVDADTLVVASSYSGRTEETLSAFTQALSTPAKKLVVTTGGELKALAKHNDIPAFTIDYTAQPRAALAHSFFPLLGICQNLSVINDKTEDVAEMVRLLENLQASIADTCAMPDNPAKQLAIKLYNHVVIIYGAGILAPVAQRWKTQVNENSKAWAFYEIFSELNHNAVVGYEFPADIADKVFVVLLRSPLLHERILVRYKVTSEVLSQAKISHEVVDATGESALSQMMSIVLFGDWVSYYLALLNETDPSPVKVIDYVKKRLAES